MGGKIFLIVAVIIIIVVAIFFLTQGKSSNKPSAGQSNAAPTPLAQTELTIMYTKSGFSPNQVTIKKGTRVTWANKSGKDATVNSDDYPANKKFPFLNLGDYPNASSVQVVFDKAGTFTYYNYFTPTHHGTVTVQ